VALRSERPASIVAAERVVRRGSMEARRAINALPGVARQARQIVDTLPESVKDEVRQSTRRLAGVRTPKDLLQALEAEVGHLSQVVVPVLAAHPLPIRSRAQAMAAAGGAAGLAAAFAEIDGIAILVTDGVLAPSAVAAGGALLAAFVNEVWVATSWRVHQIERSGRRPDPALLADELTAAVLGVNVVVARQLAGRTARAIGRRITRRWAAALVPVAGVVVDAWASTRTVKAIAALPVDGHPPTDP
jgi:hypothetical protein